MISLWQDLWNHFLFKIYILLNDYKQWETINKKDVDSSIKTLQLKNINSSIKKYKLTNTK